MDCTLVEDKTFTINEVAALFKVSDHTLRYYEKIGLIFDIKRDSCGRRVYSSRNLNWLNFLMCFKNTGMPLEKIKAYVDLMHDGEITATLRKQIMLDHKEKVENQIEELSKNLEMINYKISYYQKIEENVKHLI
ncbi:MAG: MerR family transcriptional regulator [Deltaproteobacteria bacterium]|nr:MerR family transcriptional regulator [Deltaproteobacteria bacterium]